MLVISLFGGVALLAMNAVALVELWRRELMRRRAGLNGEMANIYRSYRRRAIGRAAIGAVLVWVAQAPSCASYGNWLVVVGGVTCLLSFADWRTVKQAERLAADRLRRERMEGQL